MMKRIGDEISELTEAIHKNPGGLCLLYRFGHLRGDRPSFHFRRREDVVNLIFRKCFRRRCEIQDFSGIQIEADRFRIGTNVIRRLPECDHQDPFTGIEAGRNKMGAKSGFSRARFAGNQIHTLRDQSA